ncbi:unnamed protein product [Didymodactylos carnosus]|uniref:Uncharacterized protein n=1 Tax=Didymodactylos carnosus TaxID=1234261 RepID=A0A8S2JNA1_9BILA|nr:unnamed protein product [Didymodactylos carnosus]CAF3818764.1 unnamed protein product [Didymodactylos carnosus]
MEAIDHWEHGMTMKVKQAADETGQKVVQFQEIADVQQTKLPLKDAFDFSQLTTAKPRLVVDIPNGEWSVSGASFNSFLHYRHDVATQKLWSMKTNNNQTVIKWNNNEITYMCWSIHPNQFILLALTRIYTCDERTNQIQQTSLESNDVIFGDPGNIPDHELEKKLKKQIAGSS